MTTLVTGATGFVGSAIVRRLLAHGEEVRVLVRERSDLRNLDSLRVEKVCGDLRNSQSMELACRGIKNLYHAAADYRLWARDSQEIFNSNIEGTDNVLRAALDAGVTKIVHTSSVCTIKLRSDGIPSAENDIATADDMLGAYKQSKFHAEVRCQQLIALGAPIVIVNPSTPIGPRDVKPTPTGRIIVEAMRGAMPAYVNTGLNFVHVDDVAEGHLLAMEKGRIGERYILGGDDLPLKSLLYMIAEIAGRTPPKIELPRRAIYPLAWAAESASLLTGKEPFVTVNGLRLAKNWMYFSSEKAERELGYRFRPVREAVQDAIEWFSSASPPGVYLSHVAAAS
ncbi:MAG: NAD-dependent epimerase/dehydratase family protein [Parvularculaceae bacterium]